MEEPGRRALKMKFKIRDAGKCVGLNRVRHDMSERSQLNRKSKQSLSGYIPSR